MAAQGIEPKPAVDRASRREQLLAGTVGYLAEHGVAGLSLRPLARALGTSDRMLLYYFGTREELLRSALEDVAGRLRDVFAEGLAVERLAPRALLTAALRVSANSSARMLLSVWVQVVGLAAAGDPAAAATARAVVDDWTGWLAGRIAVPPNQQRAAAAAVLAIIDGMIVLETAGAEDDATAAANWLIPQLV